ncbi:MAG TPA: hypothetical protein VG448_10425 [Solirubrobacterales bacterium]|nr:hypothetical protein [Solirubrobacterales bacterium]
MPLATALFLCLLGTLVGAPAAFGSGSIEGAATAAGTGTPVAGLSVCAEENRVGEVSSGCTTTDPAGHYRIDGLAAGARYQVEFSALGDLNYLTQYFNRKEGLDNWDPVAVVDGSTTGGIDAVMNPGAQITGHLSERESGRPAASVEVCVLDPAPNPRAEEFERCSLSDVAGDYAVRSLPAGTYIVVFALHRPLGDLGIFEEQYFASTTDRAAATKVAVAPPETVSGIDASLVNTLRTSFHHVPGLRTVTSRAWARVGFRFSARAPVQGFVCKRDRGPWRSCRSPQRFRVPPGSHAFRVRAIGPHGLEGPISLWRFRITRKVNHTRAAATASTTLLPPGPRLATVELIETKGSERDEKASAPFMALSTFGPAGHKVRHLVKARLEEPGGQVVPFPFFSPIWAGDGSALTFVASQGKQASYFTIGADGSGLERLPGVLGPVYSADGRWMAFSRFRSHRTSGRHGGHYKSTTAWLLNLETRELRQLSSWRNGLETEPTSLSADGSLVAMTRRDSRIEGSTVVLLHLDGSAPPTLFARASEAAISPDGSRVAFAGYLNPTHIEAEENQDYDIGELYAANVDGTGVTRLTRNHTGIETSPSWDPSGERIAYVQMDADTSFDPALSFLFPLGNQIREMNGDGSCKVTVRRSPKIAFYGVAWSPDSARGAGPIPGC